jgi:hypothetical protein
MTKQLRCTVIILLITLAFGLPAIDFGLFHLDPAGVRRYFYDYEDLALLSTPAADGYRLSPGVHRFAMYSATISDDGLRMVPNNQGGSCHIVFVGDSVTFGMGANDADTFVNLLAADIPAAVSLVAFPAYSAANVALSIQDYPADGYIWLIIQNDDEPMVVWKPIDGDMPPAMALYISWLFSTGKLIPPNTIRFVRYAAPVIARADVLAFAFRGDALTEAAKQLGAIVIDHYTGHVSRYDAHPDAAGHRQIAFAMRARVMAFVNQQCSATSVAVN